MKLLITKFFVLIVGNDCIAHSLCIFMYILYVIYYVPCICMSHWWSSTACVDSRFWVDAPPRRATHPPASALKMQDGTNLKNQQSMIELFIFPLVSGGLFLGELWNPNFPCCAFFFGFLFLCFFALPCFSLLLLFCFSAFPCFSLLLLLCFFASLLLHCSASVFCVSAFLPFPASLLLCFFAFLLLCFSASSLFCFSAAFCFFIFLSLNKPQEA